MNKYRTHKCNELRKDKVGDEVILSGWINKKRDHGNLLFIDLRDNYGITQCIIDKENSNFKKLEKIQLETVIKIDGKVVERSKVISFIRNEMNKLGFLEFQTPILTSSSPEGARDFLVLMHKLNRHQVFQFEIK